MVQSGRRNDIIMQERGNTFRPSANLSIRLSRAQWSSRGSGGGGEGRQSRVRRHRGRDRLFRNLHVRQRRARRHRACTKAQLAASLKLTRRAQGVYAPIHRVRFAVRRRHYGLAPRCRPWANRRSDKTSCHRSGRPPDAELPKMPVGTVVYIEPNAAVRVRSVLEIVDDQSWLLSIADK